MDTKRVYHYDRWPKFTPSLFMHETRFPKPLGTVSGVGRVRSGGEDGEALQADVFIFAVWFHIFTALVEECGDAKDLSKGLDVLAHLKLKVDEREERSLSAAGRERAKSCMRNYTGAGAVVGYLSRSHTRDGGQRY